MVVCPVDPFVDDSYFEALSELAKLAAKGESNLTLMGIEPTKPSEKFGYIIPESNYKVSTVDTFKEKPDVETAKKYIDQGALWNGGVFAYKLGYVLNKAHDLMDFEDYADLYSKYENQNKISFDYAVVEKESKISVMRHSGVWKDLGTWNTLSEAMEEKIIGNVITNDTCDNINVINEMDVPILCVGLKDLVVAASADGILVSDKGTVGSDQALCRKHESADHVCGKILWNLPGIRC